MKSSDWVKLALGVSLFCTWTSLVLMKVDGAQDLILAIKLALAGLGAYHLNDRSSKP